MTKLAQLHVDIDVRVQTILGDPIFFQEIGLRLQFYIKIADIFNRKFEEARKIGPIWNRTSQ